VVWGRRHQEPLIQLPGLPILFTTYMDGSGQQHGVTGASALFDSLLLAVQRWMVFWFSSHICPLSRPVVSLYHVSSGWLHF